MQFMNLIYEDDGAIKAAIIFSEADSSLQVESASGKRSKIKAAAVLAKFASPSPTVAMEQGTALAQELDINFLWEVAGTEDFDAMSLGAEYFGHPPTPVELVALLTRLYEAPMYFYKRGKGKFKAAPEDALKAALAGIERKQKQAQQQAVWVEQMQAGTMPAEIAAKATSFITKPDKNSMEYKALDAACTATGQSPEQLLLKLGAFKSAYQIHYQRFLAEHFPKGIQFPVLDAPQFQGELPDAGVQAFSIDDSTTTEIDDAFSVTYDADGTIRIGIHIAAPGLAFGRAAPLDEVARGRMSTVYMPGNKITMLPDSVIEQYTLAQGRHVPALSLYVTVNQQFEILSHRTVVDRVFVAQNLRHDVLDDVVEESTLAAGDARIPFARELYTLWQFALVLSAQREAFRGKPEKNNRVDYSFYVDGAHDEPTTARIRIVPRKRDALLDRLVAELMIHANCIWGGLLHQSGVPGIYRTQMAGQSFGRVRMSTHAAPHENIGVPQYAWSTSPLRRYVDLVNQWQLIAVVQNGVTAKLVAPFKPKDADLFAVISAFDAAYTAYASVQSNLEQFWCLRWLQQEHVKQIQATVVREDVVRLDGLPIIQRIPGMPAQTRGTTVLLDVMGIDELALTLDLRLNQVLQVAQDGAVEDSEEADPSEQASDEATPLETGQPLADQASGEPTAQLVQQDLPSGAESGA